VTYARKKVGTRVYLALHSPGLRVEPRIIVLYAAYSRIVQRFYVIATLYASELFLRFHPRSAVTARLRANSLSVDFGLCIANNSAI